MPTSKLINKGKTIHLYGPVGGSFWDDEGFTAADVVQALAELDGEDEIDVHINSPGGAAFDGIAIYNAFRASEKMVRVYVDAIAASAASIIAMAGDEIIMGDGALMMIHDASGLTVGNAAEHEKQAEVLNKLDDQIAGIYDRKSSKGRKYWRKAMDGETWLSASEAISEGLATSTSGDNAPAAAWNYDLYRNSPAHLKERSKGGVFRPSAETLAYYNAVLKGAASPPVDQGEIEMTDKNGGAVPAPTLDSLRADYGDIYAQISAEGAAAERKRIGEILGQRTPGHDKIIDDAIATGVATAGDVAIAILAAERHVRAAAIIDLAADEAKLAGLRSQPAPATVDPLAGLTGAAKHKAEWAAMSDADRQPYFGREGAYLAHRKREEAARRDAA